MSDRSLADFGGGREDVRSKLNKEKKVCLDLSRWFAGTGASVYWDESPRDNNGGRVLDRTEFTTFEKTGRMADLLVIGDVRTFLIEVKDADNTAHIHDGRKQTHGYWRDIAVHGNDYRVNGEKVDIDAVLLASQYSVEGALPARWFDRAVREWPASKRFEWWDGTVHFQPEWEFSASETVTRELWRDAKADVTGEVVGFPSLNVDDDAPGIGILVSDILDSDGQPQRPSKDADELPPRRSQTAFDPKAIYKRPVAHGGGVKCHNWRWVQ